MSSTLVIITVVLVVLFGLGVLHDLKRYHLRDQAGSRRRDAGPGL